MGAVVAMAAGLVIGIGLAAGLGGTSAGWVIATVALGLGTVLAVIARRSSARPRAWAAVLLGGLAAAAGASAIAIPGNGEPPIGTARIEGEVEELRARRDHADAIVRVTRSVAIGEGSRGPPIGSRIRIRDRALPEGARVEGTIALVPPIGFRNPSPHPRWPVLDPVAADARAIAIGERGVASHARRAIAAVRAHVRGALVRTLDEPACGVARALVLGDLALDEDGDAAVRGAGLAHVLAVSGMHVTLLVGALVWLLARALGRLSWIAERWETARIAAAIGVVLAIVYAPLAGGAPSAWRAALTAAIAWSLRASGRRADPIAVTAAAVIAFGIADPAGVVRPAFLLSIAATAAILVPIDGVEERPLRALTIASVRASLATAPIVIWCFGGTPVAGVIANVVVVPIASAVLLPLAAVHALIASCAEPLAGPTAALLDGTARGFLASCEAFAAIPFGRALPPLDVAQGIVLGVGCVALLFARSARRAAIVIALAGLALGAAEVGLRSREQPRGVVRATFLDVGQGDGALIDMPDGRLVMIDAGGAVGAGIDPGAAEIVPLLAARRRPRVDLLVITHPHPDHYGGVRAVIEALEVGEIWDSGQGDDEDPEGELAVLLRDARARGIAVRRPEDVCGRDHAFGAASLRVIWPCPAFDPGWEPNDNSLVLELRIGARSMLLTGDVERHAEGELARIASHADVLKVGHHGSRTSSTEEFLRAVAPTIAIVSAGRANRFGHPHPEVVERLAASADHVVRIDREGGAIVTTDGRSIRVETWSGRASWRE